MGGGAIPYKLHVALYPPDGFNSSKVFLTEVRHPDGGAAAYREIAQVGQLKAGVWTQVTVLADLMLGTVNVTMSTDTQPVVDGGSYALQPDPLNKTTLALGLLSDGFAKWTVHLDDYVANIPPL
jgi:hypothetical protein